MRRSNKLLVPGARLGLEKFKIETAEELGIKLGEIQKGDVTSVKNCFVGGQMVKKMIEAYEKTLE